MKTVKSTQLRRAIKASKPRNPVLVALNARRSGGAGAHGKSRGALRRAERMTLAKLARDEG